MPAEVIFRPAVAADLPAILALLADDDIARSRGGYTEPPSRESANEGLPSESEDEPRPVESKGEPRPVESENEPRPSEQRGVPRRDTPVPAAVRAAFAQIDADPRNELVVADEGGAVVGTCQLTFIPGLSRGGAERMTIEAVRVRADRRSAGLGRRMMAYALNRAKERGCALAQLTTDKRRADAHRFYESLGFTASHEGMKLAL